MRWFARARWQNRWCAKAPRTKQRTAQRGVVAVFHSCRRLSDQRVEPGRDEGEILFVLERNADRAFECVRPPGATLVKKRRRFRPIHRLGDAGSLAQGL